MANEHIYVCTTLGLPHYNNPDLCGSSDATPNPQSIDSDFFSRNLLFIVKNFIDPLENDQARRPSAMAKNHELL